MYPCREALLGQARAGTTLENRDSLQMVWNGEIVVAAYAKLTSMMRMRHATFRGALLLGGLLLSAPLLIGIPLAEDLRIASGAPGGSYNALARSLVPLLANYDYDAEVLMTHGSRENLELLADGVADLAFCQIDILEDGFRQHPGSFSILGGLHREALQVVYPTALELSCLRNLGRRRVCIGEENSGTAFYSRIMLSELDIELADTLYLPPVEAADALRDGTIDAFILIAGAPSPIIEDLMREGDYSILHLPTEEARTLFDRHNYLRLMSIDSGTYPRQYVAIATIGVQAMLVASPELDAGAVQAIMNAVYSDLPRSEEARVQTRGLATQISIVSAKAGRVHAFHPDADKFLADKRPHTLLGRIVDHWQFIVFAIAPIILLALRRWLAARQSEVGRILSALVVLMLAWLIGSLFMYIFERNINDNFNSLMSSTWSTTTYLISGFEEKFPFTPGGRVISVLMIVFGLGVIAFVTGDISSILTKRRMQEVRVSTDQLQNHILVINWNRRADLILKQICESPFARKNPICVLSFDKVEMDDTIKQDRYRGTDIRWVVGDPLDKDCLAMIRAHYARSVLILANEEAEDPDAFTTLVGLAIHKLVQEAKNRAISQGETPSEPPHVSAESLNHRKKALMKEAFIDEVVCSTDYGIGILAQTTISNDISRVYDRLLTFSANTNEVRYVSRHDVDDNALWQEFIVGKKFKELSELFVQHRNPGNMPLLLIGVKRDYRFFLNPRPLDEKEGLAEQKKIENEPDLMLHKFYKFHVKDMLVFLSFERPDIRPYLKRT